MYLPIKNVTLFLVTIITSVTIGLAQEKTVNKKPNMIIILTDDQGYADLSCFGGEHVNTPRIDQMAEEGARLTNFYMAGSFCTPSRAALMTGCYPKRISLAGRVMLAIDSIGLNPSEITIAEILKSAGYKTGIVGKWHLGDQAEFMPTQQGFDEFFGIPYSHDIHPFHGNKKYNFPPLPLIEGEKLIEQEPDADYLTKRITKRAVQFIKEHKDAPFFLYIPHPAPHRPLSVSPAFRKNVSEEIAKKIDQEKQDKTINYKNRDKLYSAVISEIDWSVGQILDSLKENGIDDNTLVIFTSDNGPKIGKSTPLTGGKGSKSEGGMRVPTVIRWPENIKAGIDQDEIMTAMDLLPTFAKLAGAKVPNDRVIDGKDIWPVLSGKEKSPHQAFFYYSKNTLGAVRSENWKLHLKAGEPHALYDLEKDIGEKNNVLKEHPEVSTRLAVYVEKFEKELANNTRQPGIIKKPKPLTKRLP